MKISNERFIYEVEATDSQTLARKPFKVERREKRSFIRIEISSPLSLKTIKNGQGHFNPDASGSTIEGTILNISAGGVLVDINEELTQGDIVSMRFTLQGEVELDKVLGIVKRCESDGEGVVTGIEFVSEKKLQDILSRAEMDLIKERFTDFASGVNRMLNNFINEIENAGNNMGDDTDAGS